MHECGNTDCSNITEADLPILSDFAPDAGTLSAQYRGETSYEAVDVPNGNNLNSLGGVLDNINVAQGKYSISSAYRNPFRNALVSNVLSRHAWADAFDLRDANKKGNTPQCMEVWNGIKNRPEFEQVIVESQDYNISQFAYWYLQNIQIVPYIEGSVKFWIENGSSMDNSYEMIWTKQAGWKRITIYWKEVPEEDDRHTDYTFGAESTLSRDWTKVVTNLHAQGNHDSAWGF